MPLLFPLLAVLVWAGNTVVSKAAASVFDPAAISFYRWVIAAITLTPFCLRPLLAQRRAVLSHLPRLAVTASLGLVLNPCLSYYAAHSTSATNMGVLCALIPLIGIVLGSLVFGQRIGTPTLLGVALSLFGVCYLLGRGHPAALFDAGVNRGDVMILIGSAAYALYGILLKRWAPPLSPWLNLYVQVLLAIAILTPLALTAPSLAIPARGVGMVLFAGVASSVLAAYCWMRGVQLLGADRTAIFMNLLPLFTALIAGFTLNETIHTYHWLGGGLILLGVVLSQAKFGLALRRRVMAG